MREQVSHRALSVSGAGSPLPPITLATSRALGRQRGFDPTPHFLDRQDARRRYRFRSASSQLEADDRQLLELAREDPDAALLVVNSYLTMWQSIPSSAASRPARLERKNERG